MTIVVRQRLVSTAKRRPRAVLQVDLFMKPLIQLYQLVVVALSTL